MLEQEFSVNMFRMKGRSSPAKQLWALDSRESKKGQTLPSHHVCNLDDRIGGCLWEDTLPTSAFDIKAKNTQRGDLCPFTLRRV